MGRQGNVPWWFIRRCRKNFEFERSRVRELLSHENLTDQCVDTHFFGWAFMSKTSLGNFTEMRREEFEGRLIVHVGEASIARDAGDGSEH